MLMPNNADTPLKSIANYQNFGLRENWIAVFLAEKEDFVKTTQLGGPMIDSARLWFRQALLSMDNKKCIPAPLLKVAEKLGPDSSKLWDLIWIALTNNSPLIKWFVTTLLPNQTITPEEIKALMGNIVSEGAKKGGLQALNNLFKSSPLGTGEQTIVQLQTKGAKILSLTRVRRVPEPLVILYSLYLIAEKADRETFTLSEMMNADFESSYISPLVAFGMPVDELKAVCNGLAIRHPQFIHCKFTLGLDEIQLYPNNKNLEDVINLILEH